MAQYIIPAIATIVVAIIEALAVKDRRDRKKENEELIKRSDIRKEESRLSMQMMSASLQLSVVTANALTGGHNNGNVEEARKSAQEAQKQYNEFLQRVSAETIGA